MKDRRILTIIGIVALVIVAIAAIWYDSTLPTADEPTPSFPQRQAGPTSTVTRVGWKAATRAADPTQFPNVGYCGGDPQTDAVQNWGYIPVFWYDIEPTRGTYDFSAIDTALAALQANQCLMIKVIVNQPTAGNIIPAWVRDYVYLLPATSRGTIAAYNDIPVGNRPICSPANRATYNAGGLTTAQRTTFENYCYNSQRAAGWDAGFREVFGELLGNLAAVYDNDPRVCGIIMHSGGDYGEASLHSEYGHNIDGFLPDVSDPDNTVVRTIAEIYGVTPASIIGACQSDNSLREWGSKFYGCNGTLCWGFPYCFDRYFAYAGKELVDLYKTHWRATPLVFSAGGSMSDTGYAAGAMWVGASVDVIGYALGCYGDYYTYGKQDGWAVGSTWLGSASTIIRGIWNISYTSTNPNLSYSPGELGQSIFILEPGGKVDAVWVTEAQTQANFDAAVSNKVSQGCLYSNNMAWYTSNPAMYTSLRNNFITNFNTYSKAGLQAADSPPEPASCLGAIATVTPTATGDTPTPTPTFTATTAPTATPTGPTPTRTPTTTPATSTPTPTATPAGYIAIDYTDVVDTHLSYYSQATNYGNNISLAVGRYGYYNGLIKFDLSDVPADITVNNATITLVATSDAYPVTISFYRMTTAWVELEASWDNSETGTAWTAEGGDYYATAVGSFSVAEQGYETISVTSLVQSWLNGTYDNHGILFQHTGSQTSGIYSSEYTTTAYRPKLEIWYTAPTSTPTVTSTSVPTNTPTGTLPPTNTPTATVTYPATAFTPSADTYINTAASTTSYFNSTQIRGNSAGGLAPLLRFDLSGIPANSTIYDAKMQLYLAAQQNTTDYTSTVKLVLQDVDTDYDTTTWVSYTLATAWDTAGANAATDRSDTSYGSLLVPGAGGINTWYTVTLTSLIQGWYAGTWPNYGMKIEPGAGSANYLYWASVDNATEANRPMLWVAFATPTPTRHFGVTITDGVATTAPGSVLTYTTSITSNGSYSVDVFNRYTSVIGGTPIGATPVATWESAYGRYKWVGVTANLTPQAFTSIYSIPTEVPDGTLLTNRAFLKYLGTVVPTTVPDYSTVVVPTSTPTSTYTPTNTPTATFTPTATPAAAFFISEVMVQPTITSCDWNSDGVCNSNDQWIELFNGSSTSGDISYYKISIEASNGKTYTQTFPYQTTLDGLGRLIIWPWLTWGRAISTTGGITISNSYNTPVHSMRISGTVTPDASYQFRPEGYAAVTPVWWRWPSLAIPNMTPTPTNTYTPTPTKTPTATP